MIKYAPKRVGVIAVWGYFVWQNTALKSRPTF